MGNRREVWSQDKMVQHLCGCWEVSSGLHAEVLSLLRCPYILCLGTGLSCTGRGVRHTSPGASDWLYMNMPPVLSGWLSLYTFLGNKLECSICL